MKNLFVTSVALILLVLARPALAGKPVNVPEVPVVSTITGTGVLADPLIVNDRSLRRLLPRSRRRRFTLAKRPCGQRRWRLGTRYDWFFSSQADHRFSRSCRRGFHAAFFFADAARPHHHEV